MVRQYSTKDFFRQMPNALLARYFARHGALDNLDFATLKDTQPDTLFAAWLELPEDQRNPMDAELLEIFDMSSERGSLAIMDEAEWQLRAEPEAYTEFVEKLSQLANHYERAMVTFLDHAEFWRGATHFDHADSLSYWRKRKNLPHKPLSLDPASRIELANLIGGYFHHTEGRGKNCVVELFRRGDRDYAFAYPEDYSQQAVEWVDGEFGRRPHTPAFEVVYVYSQKDGSLDLNFRGSRKAIEPLQSMFATTMLKLPSLPPDPKDERVYDLNPLRHRSFQFVYDVGSGIQSVVVKSLRLSSRLKRGDRVTLEADTSVKADAIYDLLDKIGVALPLYHVTQVELGASVVLDNAKRPKMQPIRITYPNSCSLKYDELDLKLRDMLVASGIELQDPTETLPTTGAVEPVEA